MNANHPTRSGKRSGFTLVELLTVITIIVVLAGLTMGTMGFVQRKAAVDKARGQLALLENALERYHADIGVYPEAAPDGKDSRSGMILYYVLFGDGIGADGIRGTEDDGQPDSEPDEGATVYLSQLGPSMNSMQLLEGVRGEAPKRIVDPFGNPWIYVSGDQYEESMRNPDFDLSSAGPDGIQDTKDDITNW